MALPRFADSLHRTPLSPPVSPGERALSFYACGITPYDSAHIGHARSFVVFDAMAAVLRHAGYQVNLVRNITDIDDKILAAAQRSGEDWHALAHRFAAQNRALLAQLGVVGYEEPSASEHVGDIVALVQRLEEKGHAYQNPVTGDVLFEVASFQGAPLMPHRSEDLIRHGAHRVNHAGKRSPVDFVLWKASKPGEPSWPSPWGEGRPGWHIECSAMIERRFGATVDYHGGGTDLRFPHHQAEIQQSEAAFDRPLAHRWVHHGAVRDEKGQKMSKSLGNYVSLEEGLAQAEAVLPGAGGAVLRLALLSSLWTKPLDWSPSLLDQAAHRLQGWVAAAGTHEADPTAAQSVMEALSNNLNTPLAFSALEALAAKAEKGNVRAARGVAASLGFLGVPMSALQALRSAPDELPEEVERLIQERHRWRQERQWEKADGVRQKLEDLGYRVEDGATGATVKRVRTLR